MRTRLGWKDVRNGGEGRAVAHSSLPFPFSIYAMLRGTHTSSSAHGAPMGAEDFLSLSFVLGEVGAPPGFLCFGGHLWVGSTYPPKDEGAEK